MRPRTRAWRRRRSSFLFVVVVLISLGGLLALLATDNLALVADSLPEIGLGRLYPTDIRRELTDGFLIGALEHDGVLLNLDGNVARNRKRDGMREADGEYELRAAHLDAIADTLEDELLYVRRLDALDHILHMRCKGACQGAGETRAIAGRHAYALALDG